MIKRIDFSSLRTILFAGLIIRLIAAIFSQGYGMHDDHFLIIESSGSWVDGYDYNHWLPWDPENRGGPEGHSFTYVGINFFIFSALKTIGIVDPKILMLINRLIHGLFSLLIVFHGYKITKRLSNKKNAITVGWILALLWILPFLSVRNLVEITCIPFLMWGFWMTIKNESSSRFIWAGLLIGMAISFRYQLGVFALGMAVVYFFQKRFQAFFHFSLGVLITFSVTQGLVDYLIWKKPFAEFIAYFTYNTNEGTAYIPNNNYLMYYLILMGAFLVPFGVVLGIGFFKSWKKYLTLFIPVLLFILFHTIYPSKQERFILPVLPLFLTLGIIGFETLKEKEAWQKFWNFSWKSFWILNIPLMLLASFTYSKKSRVETMYYFYQNESEGYRILQESTGETPISMLPTFYSANWELWTIPRSSPDEMLSVHPNYHYDFILFCGEERLENRVGSYQEVYPEMELVKQCNPSFIDRFLRWLNPRNRNEYIEIWKTNSQDDFVPVRKQGWH